MYFNEITIYDKAFFDNYLKKNDTKVSELTFTNLFMWRDFYKFRFTELDGLLCIVSVPACGKPYALMPIGNVENGNLARAVAELKGYFVENGWSLVFKRVEESKLKLFEGIRDISPDKVYDRDNSDYVYLASDLIGLKGKKYDGKRNHINRFKKEHEFEYVSLNESLIGECLRIMDEWCEGRECDCQRGEYCEKYANGELLKNLSMLGCKGALVKVDGRFEAFTVGEMMNDETAVVHIEKANSRINGLYTFINQQFCANEWSGAIYINREQDLGMEGLRKAKLSYNPFELVNKYTVTVK